LYYSELRINSKQNTRVHGRNRIQSTTNYRQWAGRSINSCRKCPYRACFSKANAETKEQVMPLLEAILQAQPTVNIKTYEQTSITITMPKSRYDKMKRPQVGEIIEVNLKKI
jgi:hypothetical protein